jgi:ribosomal protein S15P/S13E
MKLDVNTIRVLGRLTDRMNLIRKHPHRYEIDPESMHELGAVAHQLEALLAKIKTIKVG